MRKGFWKQLSYEDKFDRKYACWAVNHNGWRKRKRLNRRAARRALKRLNEEAIRRNMHGGKRFLVMGRE